MKEQFIEIGFLKRSYGVKGHLRVHIQNTYVVSFDQLHHVFLCQNGDYVPYFIESTDGEAGDYLIKFDDIHNPEDARQLTGHPMFVTPDQLSDNQKNANPLQQPGHRYDGYKIIAQGYESDLVISRIDEFPGQWMAITQSEKLIPFVKEWIQSVDDERKIIFMNLPLGL